MKFFQARKGAYHTKPRFIEDVLYTTYSYNNSTTDQKSLIRSHSSQPEESSRPKVGDLLRAPDIQLQNENDNDVPAPNTKERKRRKFDSGGGQDAEIFVFEYGTVVIWGMTETEEKRFLSSMYVFKVHIVTVLK